MPPDPCSGVIALVMGRAPKAVPGRREGGKPVRWLKGGDLPSSYQFWSTSRRTTENRPPSTTCATARSSLGSFFRLLARPKLKAALTGSCILPSFQIGQYTGRRISAATSGLSSFGGGCGGTRFNGLTQPLIMSSSDCPMEFLQHRRIEVKAGIWMQAAMGVAGCTVGSDSMREVASAIETRDLQLGTTPSLPYSDQEVPEQMEPKKYNSPTNEQYSRSHIEPLTLVHKATSSGLRPSQASATTSQSSVAAPKAGKGSPARAEEPGRGAPALHLPMFLESGFWKRRDA
ncbi:hypothetical protein NMY22_g1644 [Coprinellus aureogranulatus]|nr:hypothetical protein NMY22_g1644 [Coprinellus aureogranulatus]